MARIATKSGAYRELVDAGRRRFGLEDWHGKMGRYRTRPYEFALKVLGSRWWSAQETVGRALVNHRRVAVKSGHGIGKTYLAADLALWFLYTHKPAKVITTASANRQVQFALWQEICKRFTEARISLPGRLLQTRLEVGSDSFAMGFSTDKGVKLQSFHCENLLVILDEASGVRDEIWNAAESLAVDRNNKILAIGNPLMATGRFYELFRGSGWHKVTISGLDHPNVIGKGHRIPGSITAGWVDDMVADWCEEQCGSMGECGSEPDVFTWRGKVYRPNDLFRSRVLAVFPALGSDTLIPLAWIEAAQARSLPAEGVKRLRRTSPALAVTTR